MKKRILNPFIFCLALILLSCSKDKIEDPDNIVGAANDLEKLASKPPGAATQVSGVGFFAATGECEPLLSGATYAVNMTGDLQGCLYVFIDEFNCSPSGTYREVGREYFVGTYRGKTGTFWTGYKFEGKYEGCAANGGALGAEIFGRCQHPIVAGSGTGDFAGVTGRLDFKDDVEAINFPYRGHFKF